MIVYVETNFLLELAYLQERCESCQSIMNLANRRRITLVLPSFAAAEARATSVRRSSEWTAFQTKLQTNIRQLARSEPFRNLEQESKDLVAAFTTGVEEARDRLERAIDVIKEHGVIVPLTSDILFPAAVFERFYSLSPADALVLASVVEHASTTDEQKCFLTQDAKGFDREKIYPLLSTHRCKVIVNFADAVEYLAKQLPPDT